MVYFIISLKIAALMRRVKRMKVERKKKMKVKKRLMKKMK